MEKHWWYQSDWHSKMDKSMQVNGMGESTREAYARTVRQLVEHYNKSPELITEDELLEYFIMRQEVTGWAPATMRICYSGVKFFFKHVLKREWHLLNIAQARREKRLPAVLSREEVKRVLAKVDTFHNYAYLATVYSCGLRLQEGLYLEISDIDGARKMIHVHRGKGAKDRYVPLPEATYTLLRRYWVTHRNPKLIFPAVGRARQNGPTSKIPMSIEGVQGGFRRAKHAAGIHKKGVSAHTLRHSYATHLLEAGVNLRVNPVAWKLAWNVNCQAVGNSEATLKYLAPYIFRVAISDARIIAVEGRSVTFSYRKKDSNRLRQTTLDALEFIRRFLQHVLPAGFMKVLVAVSSG